MHTRKQKLNANNKFFPMTTWLTYCYSSWGKVRILWQCHCLAGIKTRVFKKKSTRRKIFIVTEYYTPGRFWRMAARYTVIHDAANEAPLCFYNSQSQTQRSLICSEQSCMLNFCYFSCKTTRPPSDYQLIVTDNPVGYF